MRTSAPLTIATAMPGWAGRAPVGGPFAGGVDIGDIFGDLFGEMFSVGGNAQRGSRQKRGDDLRFDLTIDFEDAFFGIETEVKIRRLETCASATAAAARRAADQRLRQCQGRGQIRYQQGFFSVARPAAHAAAPASDRRSVPRAAARRERQRKSSSR